MRLISLKDSRSDGGLLAFRRVIVLPLRQTGDIFPVVKEKLNMRRSRLNSNIFERRCCRARVPFLAAYFKAFLSSSSAVKSRTELIYPVANEEIF